MNLKNLLYEAAEPEADKEDVFGQYLFAPQRKDIEKDIPEEPNTEFEQKFRYALHDFFDNNYQGSLEPMASKILDLIAKHKYVRLLDPGEKTVYRGVTVDAEFLQNLLASLGEEVKHNKYVVVKASNQLKPLKSKLLQSWTIKPTTAADFSVMNSTDPDDVALIFAAQTKNNAFFVNPDSNLDDIVQSNIPDEKETISFGAVNIVGFVYYAPDSSTHKPATVEKMAAAVRKLK